LRAHGIVPLSGDLDNAGKLARLAGLPHDLVHFAPPPTEGTRDPRTKNLIQALKRSASIPQRLVYISTSGVYGDCDGELVAEHRTPRPQTDRGRRRMAAERMLRDYGRQSGVKVVILRVPGIYAEDRLPIERIRAQTPALLPAEDSYSNHIHADDLARIVLAALSRGGRGRAYHASDGTWLKMGDYFDLVAEYAGIPKPPRIARADAERVLPQTLLSFMRESRRLSNRRLRTELRIRLNYPSVEQGLGHRTARLGAISANPGGPAIRIPCRS
jgi:nucleoside-diphosphate-sugar epimerase